MLKCVADGCPKCPDACHCRECDCYYKEHEEFEEQMTGIEEEELYTSDEKRMLFVFISGISLFFNLIVYANLFGWV